MSTRLAKRLDAVAPSATLAMAAKAQKLRAAGHKVFSFSVGEPDFQPPAHVVAAAQEALARGGVSHYTAVTGTADLKAAIGGITSVWGFHSGQICTAPTRVICQRGVYDHLVAGLTQAVGHMKVGDPLERDTVVGPVITGVHRERIEGYIQTARDEGGTIATGGERPDIDGKGFYVAPTLIVDCKPGMTVVQEELFGPVVVVVPFDEAEEAADLANSTDFGLYDYVFSKDTAKAFATARELFVHPNTVRYRLKRVSDVIGWDATGAREALILQSALIIGSMSDHDAAPRRRPSS